MARYSRSSYGGSRRRKSSLRSSGGYRRRSAAPKRRATGSRVRARTQDIRLVIETVPANQVTRGAFAFAQKLNPPPKKAKL